MTQVGQGGVFIEIAPSALLLRNDGILDGILNGILNEIASAFSKPRNDAGNSKFFMMRSPEGIGG